MPHMQRTPGFRRSTTCLPIALLPIATIVRADGPAIIYVNAHATGANSGQSWQDAYHDLQSALDLAAEPTSPPTQIRIAQGTYRPTKRTDPDDPRSVTFRIPSGVEMYGGFAGFEDQRHPLYRQIYPTVLSGDLANNDGGQFPGNTENARHVLSAVDLAQVSVLDGLVIRRGVTGSTTDGGGGLRVVGSHFALRDCTFENNLHAHGIDAGSEIASARWYCFAGGGAIYLDENSTLDVTGCEFRGNDSAEFGGGALFADGGRARFQDCDFTFNRAGCGGAVLSRDAVLSFDQCNFDRNGSDSYGGGAVHHEGRTILQITGANFVDNDASDEGGAVYAGGETLIRDTFFVRNFADRGAAIFADRHTLTLERCTFQRHLDGAVVLVEDWDNTGSLLQVVDSLFRDNRGTGSYTNAGIVLSGARARIDRTQFEDNDGSALWFADSTVDVNGCSFRENRGNAIEQVHGVTELADCQVSRNHYLDSSIWVLDGVIHIDRSMFDGNYAERGSGITLFGAQESSIRNSVFVRNISGAYGGAIEHVTGRLTIDGCTLAYNSAVGRGGGILSGAPIAVSNSILWGNRTTVDQRVYIDELAQLDVARDFSIDYSCVQDWTGAIGGHGNFGDDPMFVRLPDLQGDVIVGNEDLHLRIDSPAINTGAPPLDDGAARGTTTSVERDLDGRPRVLCGRVDRGAYEFGILGDYDCDQAVLVGDFHAWPSCALGPGSSTGADLGCEAFEFDVDSDIDLADFARFQRAFGGSTL